MNDYEIENIQAMIDRYLSGPSQTERVYFAQHRAFRDEGNMANEYRPKVDFATRRELELFAEQVRTSKFVAKHWPKTAKQPAIYELFNVIPGDWPVGREEGPEGQTNIEQRIIQISEKGASKATVLHELAHLIDGDSSTGQEIYMADPSGGHGPRYVGILLALIREFIGVSEALKFERSLQYYGASYVSA